MGQNKLLLPFQWINQVSLVPDLGRDRAAGPIVGGNRLRAQGGVELVPVDHLGLELQVEDEILARLTCAVPEMDALSLDINKPLNEKLTHTSEQK